ncbi:MAG TPA: aconitate hydratase [Spirochaetia bacterium]|nr:aconitate hydratase [Spirochaetia bacterium]
MEHHYNVTQKLISSHLESGTMQPGAEIKLRIDHILQQDATGTMVMLELEAMGIRRVKAECAVQYVDHNLLQADYKNADDHRFLETAAARFGYWFSRPGNGISHVVHMERFGAPGKTMIGSDSHTCSAGCLGMLAMGTGGLDITLAVTGRPYCITMPVVAGVKLTGRLPDWVSAKDVILEMLRRFDVTGGRGKIYEYHGDGVATLSAWDRLVIANMGAELGATTTVFPSDERTREFLAAQGRENVWRELTADPDAVYDEEIEIDLAELEPLIACPVSPGNVVPVSQVEGTPISQVVIGSSANPGLRDFWIVGRIVCDQTLPPSVSLDINPSSRQILENMSALGVIGDLVAAGARLHQTGCMGCIGMGQAPASGSISLRTMPRNFPGRSGTDDDQVYLCSPETGAASALSGVITDPRRLAENRRLTYPRWREPVPTIINTRMLIPPPASGRKTVLVKGPNIKSLPEFPALPDSFEGPVILKAGDNISTDEILKAGATVLPLRSNIEEISKYAYSVLDDAYYEKALRARESQGGHIVTAGENFAQGSSREHAALAPRYLGEQAVIAKSYARIGRQNLINFGIVPFEFSDPADYDALAENDVLVLSNLRAAMAPGTPLSARRLSDGRTFSLRSPFSERERRILLAGGIINFLKKEPKAV